jgi:hypothetical protein
MQGNERADAEAKKAAEDRTLTQLRGHRPLKLARTYIKVATKEQWHKISTEDTKSAEALRHITIDPKLYNEITNRNTAARRILDNLTKP